MQKYITFPNFNQMDDIHCSWDFHTHADFVDGEDSVANMTIGAIETGLTRIAFTEHARSSYASWWKNYVEQVKDSREKQRGNIEVILGLEANAIGDFGNVDLTEFMIENTELTLGSVHGYYDNETWDIIPASSLSFEEALNYELCHIRGLSENPIVDVLAHPFWLFKKNFGLPPVEAYESMLAFACENNTAVEINFRYTKELIYVKELFSKFNPLISPGSNAHNVAQLYSPEEAKGMFR